MLRLLTSFVVLFAMIGLSLVTTTSVSATHNSTSCKWDFPWPRQVKYWIEQGTDEGNEFSAAEATRVAYGPATWSEGNFNLYFTRVSTVAQSDGAATMIVKGTVSNYQYVAETIVTPSPDCNRDQGNPITSVETVFDHNDSFNLDCNANHATCVYLNQFDLHNTSSHELGHWFTMKDVKDTPSTATMWYAESYGEYNKRDLDQHDKDTAWIMYGCRGGATCH
jgi:predicted Zn-dependent protease